jgi:hypothetical protein
MRMSHIVICGLPGIYSIFPHYLINGTIFATKKKLLNIKCVFWFSLQLLSETFLILKKKLSEVLSKFVLVFMWSTHYFRQIWMKIEFSWQIFEKSSNIKFRKNPSSGSRVVPWGRRDSRPDRHDAANSRFWQFCERTWKFTLPHEIFNAQRKDQYLRVQTRHVAWSDVDTWQP